MIMKELVLSALTALLTFGVSEAAVLTAEQAKEADKGQNGGNTRVVKVEIGQFINQTEKDIDELVEIIDEKLEERREREDRV